jgi:hypothetical protein
MSPAAASSAKVWISILYANDPGVVLQEDPTR